MGNFSSMKAPRNAQDKYIPAQAKALRDRVRILPVSNAMRKQLFQKAAQLIFKYNNVESKGIRHGVDCAVSIERRLSRTPSDASYGRMSSSCSLWYADCIQ